MARRGGRPYIDFSNWTPEQAMWQRSDYFRSLTLGRLPLVNCFKGVTDRGKRFCRPSLLQGDN